MKEYTIAISFLTQSDDGKSLEVERFLRECLKSYPHVHSILLKQIISSVAKVPLVSQVYDQAISDYSLLG